MTTIPSPEESLALVDQVIQDPTLSPDEKLGRIRNLRSPHKHTDTGLTVQTNGVTDLTHQQTIDLIKSNLQETLDPTKIIEDVIMKQGRPLKIYWGTAPTGRPHCGYFVPMLKIAEFLRAGANVKILLADLHAFLDNLKAPIEKVKYRASYYKFIIIGLMNALGVPIEKLEFVLGSSYQLSSAYQMDLLRSCTKVSPRDARKAGSEVVKQVDEEKARLSGLIYPVMQALDEQYLDVDAQFGGVDQRKIFTLAKDHLPDIGYKTRAHLMNPMVPGLGQGGKMSASDPDSKIDILEEPEVVEKKISKAYCPPQIVEENGVLAFVQYTLMPASALRSGKPRFGIERKDAEPLVYESMDQIYEDYRADVLNPQLLKAGVSKALNELLAPIQATFKSSNEFQEVTEKAYGPDEAEIEKAKQVQAAKDAKKAAKKNKGSGRPTTGPKTPRVATQPDGTVEGRDKGQVEIASNATGAMQELKIEKDMVNGT